MYPNTYSNLFPPFPKDNRAFVAMSFDSLFENRWQNVLIPAIQSVRRNNIPMEPCRVDLRRASDSILTEILEGIGRSRFFIADITTIGVLNGRPVRNGNVLYEVGLAHALRLPEEVLLLRSDDDDLLFDVANIRVVKYDPDADVLKAQKLVAEAILQSLRELDLRKALSVRQIADSLDLHAWLLLFEAQGHPSVRQPQCKTMGQALGGAPRREALRHLLEIGALKAELVKFSVDTATQFAGSSVEDLICYGITEFGRSLAVHGAEAMGLQSPGVREAIGRAVANDNPG